jgi:hypothetical protein
MVDDPHDEIAREVDRLFKANLMFRGALRQIPVIGGDYIPGEDHTRCLRRRARLALRAREWFATHGPADAPPLPLSYDEREDLKSRGSLPTLVALYARSLSRRNYDVEEHPAFFDYACGALDSKHNGYPCFRRDESLRKRFPPRPLACLDLGLHWWPPDEHAKIVAAYRITYPDRCPTCIAVPLHGRNPARVPLTLRW